MPSLVVRWLVRLVAWDGALPLVIWTVPLLLHLVFPRWPQVIDLCAIGLPIAGFMVRLYRGRECIATNGCGPAVRLLQFTAMFLGLFLLALIDGLFVCVLILDQKGIPPLLARVFLGAYAVYLLLMSFAMYPGRLTSHTSPAWSAEMGA